jgi:hypothetical protein
VGYRGFLRWSGLGKFLRARNTVRRSMTTIRPRSESSTSVADFSASVPGYVHRRRLTAGVAGLAQVCRLQSTTSVGERVDTDNLCIDHRSLFRDPRLSLVTVRAAVRQGAYAEVEDTSNETDLSDHAVVYVAPMHLLGPARPWADSGTRVPRVEFTKTVSNLKVEVRP